MGLLDDQVAVITGGSRGLGLAIAEAYAREGAAVVIASRSQKSVDVAVQAIQAQGRRASGLACDVGDLAQVQALAGHALAIFGRLDVWVNNAGLSAPYGPTAHLPSADFQATINTNIVGVYNGSVTALRHFVPQQRGKLINLLGRGDNSPVPLQNAYASSKTWVRSFTSALAKEYANSGVGVYAFNPGLVTTEMLSHVQAVRGYETKLNPLKVVVGFLGNPPEVPAERALWIASSATDDRTGLSVKVLTPGFLLARGLRAAWRWITRTVEPEMVLNVETVTPAL
jgi:NAD(P)-dependent dehydrogenase (short-subunit alcohol dehydrogenase family)